MAAGRTILGRVTDPLPAEQRRASDADREHVAERLRDAAGDGRLTIPELEERLEAAFSARTYAELEPLTHDLPDHPHPAPRVPSTLRPAGSPARVTGREGRTWSLALMSGTTRHGRWAMGSRHTAISVMGGVDLDLRDAELETSEVTIWAFTLMGGIDVVVPDDCALDASGFGLMGGFDQTEHAPVAPPGAPVVRVRGLALMGGIDVHRKPRRSRATDEVESGSRRRELES